MSLNRKGLLVVARRGKSRWSNTWRKIGLRSKGCLANSPPFQCNAGLPLFFVMLYKIRHKSSGKYLYDIFNNINGKYFTTTEGRIFNRKSDAVSYFVMAIKRNKIKQDDFVIESFGLTSKGDLDSKKELYLGIEKKKKYDLKYESGRLKKVMQAMLKEIL